MVHDAVEGMRSGGGRWLPRVCYPRSGLNSFKLFPTLTQASLLPLLHAGDLLSLAHHSCSCLVHAEEKHLATLPSRSLLACCLCVDAPLSCPPRAHAPRCVLQRRRASWPTSRCRRARSSSANSSRRRKRSTGRMGRGEEGVGLKG